MKKDKNKNHLLSRRLFFKRVICNAADIGGAYNFSFNFIC